MCRNRKVRKGGLRIHCIHHTPQILPTKGGGRLAVHYHYLLRVLAAVCQGSAGESSQAAQATVTDESCQSAGLRLRTV